MMAAILKPLQPWLARRDILELTAVHAGAINVEKEAGFVQQEAPALTRRFWQRLCFALANQQGQVFHPEHQPIYSGMLPGGHRIEALIGPHVDSKLSVTIRMRRALPPLQAFGLSQAQIQHIRDAFLAGANILISGATSSGKTTLMNHLIQWLPLDTRVLTIEDTREMYLSHNHNSPQYVLPRRKQQGLLDYKTLLDHVVRARPDRILLGEIAIDNAYAALRLLSSGATGFLASIHAASPQQALEHAFVQNIALSGMLATGISQALTETVDMVIQMKREGHKRFVSQLFNPKNQTDFLNN